MKFSLIAESHFQNSLAKFDPTRKPDDKGFTTTGFEREMFRLGAEWFMLECVENQLEQYKYQGMKADELYRRLTDEKN